MASDLDATAKSSLPVSRIEYRGQSLFLVICAVPDPNRDSRNILKIEGKIVAL